MTVPKKAGAGQSKTRKREQPTEAMKHSDPFNDDKPFQNLKYVAGVTRQITIQNDWIDRSEKRRREDSSLEDATDIKNLAYFLDKLLAIPLDPLHKIALAWCDGVCPQRMAGDPRAQFEWILERAGLNAWNKFEGCLQGCRNGGLEDINTQYCVVLCVYLLRLRPSVQQVDVWHGGDIDRNPSRRWPPLTWTDYLKSLAPPKLFTDMQDVRATHRHRWARAAKAMYDAAAREEYFEIQLRHVPLPSKSAQFITEHPERLLMFDSRSADGEKKVEWEGADEQLLLVDTRAMPNTQPPEQGTVESNNSRTYEATKAAIAEVAEYMNHYMPKRYVSDDNAPVETTIASNQLPDSTIKAPTPVHPFQLDPSVLHGDSFQSCGPSQLDEGVQIRDNSLSTNSYEPWLFDVFQGIDFSSDPLSWKLDGVPQQVGVGL